MAGPPATAVPAVATGVTAKTPDQTGRPAAPAADVPAARSRSCTRAKPRAASRGPEAALVLQRSNPKKAGPQVSWRPTWEANDRGHRTFGGAQRSSHHYRVAHGCGPRGNGAAGRHAPLAGGLRPHREP